MKISQGDRPVNESIVIVRQSALLDQVAHHLQREGRNEYSRAAAARFHLQRTLRIFGMPFSRRSKAAEPLAEEIDILHKSALVDPVWYRQTYPDLRDTPVDVARHYLEHGAAEGRNPGPFFDTNFYLGQNPDVVAPGMKSRLVHYIDMGPRKAETSTL